MKWLIKNPAPKNRRKKKWGDYNFGMALTQSLRKLGHEVDTDFFGKWCNRKKADVVLVLRGDFQYDKKNHDFTILWVYSHPETVSIEECDQYDVVCVCSQLHADRLRNQISKPIAVIPQCVDTTRFFLDKDNSKIGKDIIFVGNTRISRRNTVIWAIEAGIPVKIWGRGWEEVVDPNFIVSKQIDNKLLAGLYQQSKLTLNDHFLDMRNWGYINNRVYDALACGLPVLSDHVPGLPENFRGAVLSYRNKHEFELCLERLLLQYPEIKQAARKAAKIVAENHSFDNRAQALTDLASHYKLAIKSKA